MKKLDDRLVGALGVSDGIPALVRVRSPRHLSVLERNFNVTHRYPFICALGIDCTRSDAEKLEIMHEVEYVSAQSCVNAFDSRTDVFSDFFGAADISVFSSRGLTGKGATLCVMDTGISLHSDLSLPRERIVGFVDMINGKTEPYDDNGHGTFVCGVAAGNGMLSGRKIRGVAPDADIVGLKVIAANGESGTFKILDGMQWLFDNFRKFGISVVCMSFGADPLPYADPLKLGAEMLVSSGLTVVCASGNSGVNNLKSPGVSPEVISVGAVDEHDRLADFSSCGVYQGIYRPDVNARGVKINGISAGGTYSVMSGTSVAAPYVAGACCLLKEKYRNITPRQMKSAIVSSSRIKNGLKVFSLDET